MPKKNWDKKKPIPAGFRSGSLTVVSETEERSSDRQIMYLCQCDCGQQVVVRGQHIRKRLTASCGCQGSRARIGNRSETHGAQKQEADMLLKKAYSTWANMKTRCTNRTDPHYPFYGGRGITVCKQWHDSFEIFLKDMGLPPNAECSIDRIDNNQGYMPGNCQWADRETQANNRRSCYRLEYNGTVYSMSGLAKKLGISRHRLKRRLYVKGMSLAETLADLGIQQESR